uniref:NADH dehydrogenase subunit 4L n=1 Tax=Meloidogyne oryzae TaxID=325757 RepID=A0A481X4E5_9BILA|nr:NADH dehydrogenase subunit 4L [Meloidogyne oryzae]
MVSLLILLFFLFMMIKFIRLIYVLISLEFLFLSIFFFILEMNKISDFLMILFFGVFSSIFCLSVYLKYIFFFGCDFVKF